MHRLLLIEDSQTTQTLVQALVPKGCLLTLAKNLTEARKQIKENVFDLILLDVELPDGDGFQFLAQMQSDGVETPVLMLTGRVQTADKVMGFSLGAEDYIVKPFDPVELRARIEARLKRVKKTREGDDAYRKGSLLFSLSMQKLFLTMEDQQEVELTPIEFKLLLYLARHEDHVLSRDQLIDAVWGDKVHVGDRTIDTHISNLRKKIRGCEYQIKAIHGVGYSFKKSYASESKAAA